MNESATVDLRFYSSLERHINQGHAASTQELQLVQQFLEKWSSSYLQEFRQSLPTQFTFLWGSFHSALLPPAYRAFNIPESKSFVRWKKYLISSKSLPSPNRQPPSGFEIDAIYTQHFDVIMSTSSIPRTKAYLQTRIAASTALYSDKSRDSTPPVAFCITAPDSSISTLWVDPAYRCRGLGKFIARERLLGPNGMFSSICSTSEMGKKENVAAAKVEEVSEKNCRWSHADVLESNIESRKICEWFGVQGWDTVWMRVEVRTSNRPRTFSSEEVDKKLLRYQTR